MTEFMLTSLQKALNYYLALDPEVFRRLTLLQDKIVTIELEKTGLIFQLIFTDNEIQLKKNYFLNADTVIKGTPFSLLRLTLTQGDRKHFFAEDVTITGDLDVGQQVMDLFDQLEIDWEEGLSHYLGDVPAHQFVLLARRIKQASQRTRRRLLQNINEYFHEEINVVPPAEALQDFFADVDLLRMDVDRMAARIALLKNKMNND